MTTKTNPSNSKTRFTPLKRKAEAEGFSYTSVRDAVARGELRVVRIGKNEKHQRSYVEQADWERWLDSRRRSA